MSEPFLAEIRMVGFNFAPRGWAMCDGQLLPINQNQALFSLLGTTYGGNGQVTFALPDLRGRVPVHVGAQPGGPFFAEGQSGGTETHTLTANELPSHNHNVQAANVAGTTNDPSNKVFSVTKDQKPLYAGAGTQVAMNPGVVSNSGGNQAHNNIQPIITLNFIIALQGLFPSRN